MIKKKNVNFKMKKNKKIAEIYEFRLIEHT